MDFYLLFCQRLRIWPENTFTFRVARRDDFRDTFCIYDSIYWSGKFYLLSRFQSFEVPFSPPKYDISKWRPVLKNSLRKMFQFWNPEMFRNRCRTGYYVHMKCEVSNKEFKSRIEMCTQFLNAVRILWN